MQYFAGQVPTSENIGQLQRWLREEFRRVQRSTDDIYPLYELVRVIPQGHVLHGDVDNFTLNTTDSRLTNYTEQTPIGQYSGIAVDAANGTMTVKYEGTYQLTAHVIGDQGNSNKEESARLLVDIDGTRTAIWVRDIATDKTDERCFTGSFVLTFNGGEVVSLYMDATTGLGTFNTSFVNFTIVSMAITDPQYREQFE